MAPDKEAAQGDNVVYTALSHSLFHSKHLK